MRLRPWTIAPTGVFLAVSASTVGARADAMGSAVPVWIGATATPPLRHIRLMAGHPRDPDRVAVAGPRKVFLSKDSARTWVRMLRLSSLPSDAEDAEDEQAESPLINDLLMDARTLYVATRQGLYCGPQKSSRLNRCPGLPFRKSVAALAHNPHRGRQVFAAVGRCLWETRDHGRTFRRVSCPWPSGIVSLAAARGPSRHVMASTGRQTYISSDSGRTFRVIPALGRSAAVAAVVRSGGGVVPVSAHKRGILVLKRWHRNRSPVAQRTPVHDNIVQLETDIDGRANVFWAAGRSVWLFGPGVPIRVDLGISGSGGKKVVSRPVRGARNRNPSAWVATPRRLYRLKWVSVGPLRGSAHRACTGAAQDHRVRSGLNPKRAKSAAWLPRLTLDLSFRQRSGRSTWRTVSDPWARGRGSPFLWAVTVTLTWDLESVLHSGAGRDADFLLRKSRKWIVDRRIRQRRTRFACRRLSVLLRAATNLSGPERVALELQRQYLEALIRKKPSKEGTCSGSSRCWLP